MRNPLTGEHDHSYTLSNWIEDHPALSVLYSFGAFCVGDFIYHVLAR